jgi:RNA polymerase sigma-70 factor (ECF subfamily)
VRERKLFEEAFDQHYELIFRYLRRRTNSELASDLTAETFFIALRDLDKFDPERGNIRAWLFGIASNQMKREKRREKRELRAFARTGVDLASSDSTAESDRRLDARSHQRELAAGLASLKTGDREALLLYCWADLNYAEIAEALGIPDGTVKSRIARARRKLRKHLGASLERPSGFQNEEVTDG